MNRPTPTTEVGETARHCGEHRCGRRIAGMVIVLFLLASGWLLLRENIAAKACMPAKITSASGAPLTAAQVEEYREQGFCMR